MGREHYAVFPYGFEKWLRGAGFVCYNTGD
jgi:hypothetical protein